MQPRKRLRDARNISAYDDWNVPCITQLYTRLNLVNTFHCAFALEFLQKSFFKPFSSKLHLNRISKGNSSVDCGVQNRPIFVYKVTKEALWTVVWYSKILTQSSYDVGIELRTERGNHLRTMLALVTFLKLNNKTP